jgi:peptidyl-prolyl cis-trans isomerase SurA
MRHASLAALLLSGLTGMGLLGHGAVALAEPSALPVPPMVPMTEPAVPPAKPVNPQAKPINPQAKPINPQAKPINPMTQPVVPQAKPVLIDRIAAVVNRDIITLSDVQEAVLQQAVAVAAARGGSRPQAGDPVFASAALTSQALSQQLHRLIDRRLQEQDAEQLGITVTDAELHQALEDIKTRNRFTSDEALATALATEGLTLEQYRRQLRSELLVAKLVNREVRSTVVVSPEEVRVYYDQHPEEFALPERIRLRRIFFAAPAANEEEHANARANAQAVLDELNNGADFDQMARRYSNGPEAKEGGELGWFTPGSLMPQLDRIAFMLKDGQISGLIDTPQGWHILKMEAREGHHQETFEQAQEKVHARLMEQRTQERYEEWFLELRRNAYVDIRL